MFFRAGLFPDLHHPSVIPSEAISRPLQPSTHRQSVSYSYRGNSALLLLFASSYFNCSFLVSLLCFCCSWNNTQLPCSSLRWSSATTHLLRLHNLRWLSITTHPFRLHASAAFTSPPCPSARRISLEINEWINQLSHSAPQPNTDSVLQVIPPFTGQLFSLVSMKT